MSTAKKTTKKSTTHRLPRAVVRAERAWEEAVLVWGYARRLAEYKRNAYFLDRVTKDEVRAADREMREAAMDKRKARNHMLNLLLRDKILPQ